MPPVLLTIQTATPAGSVAVTDGSALLAEINLQCRRTPTDWLMPMIDMLLTTTERSLIVRQMADRAHFAPAFIDLPRAAAAASLAQQDWAAGVRCTADQLMPVYLRPSEAELNFPTAGLQG
ncbi:MAG: hypothetical protein P8Y96_04515 [Desulfuromonadales bacterium]